MRDALSISGGKEHLHLRDRGMLEESKQTGLAKLFIVHYTYFILFVLSYFYMTAQSSSTHSGWIRYSFLYEGPYISHLKLILNKSVCFSPVNLSLSV